MRARMALKLADIDVEIREISMREKPPHLLEISPKATVPVLVLADGMVIEESLEIMFWAFNNAREKNDALQGNIHAPSRALVLMNDTEFKKNLDCYKYPERYPEKLQLEYRQQCEVFLQKLEKLLQQNTFLFAAMPCFADYAIFPFIRQFAAVDSAWFEAAAYPKLRAWLNGWLSSELFVSIMQKQPTFK
jgi:glutathione S-transferase